MRAIEQTRFGGPEVLELVDLPEPRPAPTGDLIAVTTAGVNFADLHARENNYLKQQDLPRIPGSEVAGTLDGSRVLAYCDTGGYAEMVLAPKPLVFAIPDDIDDDVALSLFVQGVTAHQLTTVAAPIRSGDSVVVVSGAGGTGSLLIALARHLGAGRVIATASSADKRAHCLELGADAAIDGAPAGLMERLLTANGDSPVDVVYDSSGGEVFAQALTALAPFGRLAVYGISSGEANDVRTSALLRGSQTVAGFWLEHCRQRPQMIAASLGGLFDLVRDGVIAPSIGGRYPLAAAADAHRDLAARRTTGKLVLDVASR